MTKFVYTNLIFLTLLWVVIIFGLCATPGQYIPSFTWLDLFSFDKLVHSSIFFILSVLCFMTGFKFKKTKSFFILCLCLAIIYGISLEFMQAAIFINRSFDWMDMVANSTGCIAAYLLLRKIKIFYLQKIRVSS